MCSIRPMEVKALVIERSQARVSVGVDEVVGRYLVATEDLAVTEPVLTEDALLAGTDEARSLRAVVEQGAAEAMLEAWWRPEDGGSNLLAHMDLFCGYVLTRATALGHNCTIGSEIAKAASETLRRLDRWFCVPDERQVDRDAQMDKLKMIHGALKSRFRNCVSLDNLRHLDNVLNQNAEDFTGAIAVMRGDDDARPACLGRRRFQGIFPCKDLIQHSCEPNCITVAGPDVPHPVPLAASGGVFHEGRMERFVMQVLPLRPIAKGERLTWNYLPYWKLVWPTQLRRQALHEGWGFVCECPRCSGARREVVMAFRCPACGQGDLCPDRACVSSEGCADREASGCCHGHGHALAMMEVSVLQCGCGHRLARGNSESTDDGYFERCLAQETQIFNLPWQGVIGREPHQNGLGSTDLLAETHWLFADHASHLLENAAKIASHRSLDIEDSDLVAVCETLQQLARAADIVVAVVTRLLASDRFVDLPGLLLWKALCTGAERDFEECRNAHRQVFDRCRGARAIVAAAERLCLSSAAFVAEGLQMSPGTAERLLLRIPLGREARVPVVAEAFPALAGEVTLVRTWVGRINSQTDERQDVGEDIVIPSTSVWILRRMWLCPNFDADLNKHICNGELMMRKTRKHGHGAPHAMRVHRKRAGSEASCSKAHERLVAVGRDAGCPKAREKHAASGKVVVSHLKIHTTNVKRNVQSDFEVRKKSQFGHGAVFIRRVRLSRKGRDPSSSRVHLKLAGFPATASTRKRPAAKTTLAARVARK